MPCWVHPGLSPLPHLPAPHLLLCFGHCLHVVCLDQSILTVHGFNEQSCFSQLLLLLLLSLLEVNVDAIFVSHKNVRK